LQEHCDGSWFIFPLNSLNITRYGSNDVFLFLNDPAILRSREKREMSVGYATVAVPFSTARLVYTHLT